ncbi:hypothetical protein [Paracoccus mutanolyticus]|uniref:hypothetical protein n=1 Tax=Paracoccus mutanolyticus TaxID=1499308 RepID=UPI0011AE6B10|nr:hypothetical protein [Paracoccus mutanolyticus]
MTEPIRRSNRPCCSNPPAIPLSAIVFNRRGSWAVRHSNTGYRLWRKSGAAAEARSLARVIVDESKPGFRNIEPVAYEAEPGLPRKFYYDGGSVEIIRQLVYELDSEGKQLAVRQLTDYTGEKVRTRLRQKPRTAGEGISLVEIEGAAIGGLP